MYKKPVKMQSQFCLLPNKSVLEIGSDLKLASFIFCLVPEAETPSAQAAATSSRGR